MRTAVEVSRDGALVVDGELRHVFVDLSTREKAPIPPWLRSALAPWTVRG